MKKTLNAEHAALTLAQGKAGTCGFLVNPDGRTEFMGFGVRRPVQMLRLAVNGKVFTETTSPFNLVIRRGTPNRPAWAVLADQEWQTLSASDNTNTTITCIALIDPPRTHSLQQVSEPTSKIPLAVKAYFGPDYGGMVVLCEDHDFCNLLLAESTSMVPCEIEQHETAR